MHLGLRGPNICPMSQRAETRISDIVVVILFVLVVGWLATHSHSPAESSIPGVSWAPAPAASEMIQESKTIVEGDPLPPSDADMIPVTPTPVEGVTPPAETPGQSEDWQ